MTGVLLLFSFSDKARDTEELSNLPKVTQLASGTGVGAQAFCQEKTFSNTLGGRFWPLAACCALVVAWHQAECYLLNGCFIIKGQCS